jgi:hypothetical protein
MITCAHLSLYPMELRVLCHLLPHGGDAVLGSQLLPIQPEQTPEKNCGQTSRLLVGSRSSNQHARGSCTGRGVLFFIINSTVCVVNQDTGHTCRRAEFGIRHQSDMVRNTRKNFICVQNTKKRTALSLFAQASRVDAEQDRDFCSLSLLSGPPFNSIAHKIRF